MEFGAKEPEWRRTAKVTKNVVRVLPQTGRKPFIPIDKGRVAVVPGKRISATGKTYWETRKNRSDKVGTRL
jgi:hypothetical protein